MSDLGDFDVCVVGTGAGGGIAAYELAMAGFKVLSLEHGPLLPDDYFATVDPPGAVLDYGIRPHTVWPSDPHEAFFGNKLFAASEEGSAPRLDDTFRPYQVFAVGGLQNLWNGVSLRFSAEDTASWPLDYADLAGHYGHVEKLITVCGTRENIPALPDGEYIEPKPLRPIDRLLAKAVAAVGDQHARAIPNRKAINTRAGVTPSCVSTGACAFGCPVGAIYKFPARLLPRLRGRTNYTLRADAKVTRLLTTGDGRRIDGVEFRDMATGDLHRVTARVVVLAAGAIETPRILFNSATDADPAGLANRNDQLGRRLQDNPKTVLSTSLWKLWGQRRDYDVGYGDPLVILGRETLPDGDTFAFIGHDSHGVPDVPHYLTGFSAFPPALKRVLARTMFHSYLTIGLFCGGDPDPANRVRPGRRKDRFGIPQVDIDFTSSPRAKAQMRAMERWGRRVLRKASGTLIHGDSSNNGTGIHYAGTTAMSADPGAGVVDGHLRAHEVENLYVCDGGAIPTLPEKHLTLTIMALARKAAVHIGDQLRDGRPGAV